jgi:hypothetical protein
MFSAANREVTVEQDRPEAAAARERQAAMVEELRKAELVRDRLESLQQLVGSYPEGHHTRVLLEDLHLDRALRVVEEDIGGPSGLPPLPSQHLINCRPSQNTSDGVPTAGELLRIHLPRSWVNKAKMFQRLAHR